MFVLCVYIYFVYKIWCGIFDGNNTDRKQNIFNNVGFIDCIKLYWISKKILSSNREKYAQECFIFVFTSGLWRY